MLYAADTTFLVEIEDHVRAKLSDDFSAEFTKQYLVLPGGGRHEFDAVSDDRQFIASIKSASGRTSGGRHPAAKVKDCIAELYYLSLVNAQRRALILTTPDFHALFIRVMAGKIAPGLEVMHYPLPEHLQAKVAAVQTLASKEMSLEAAEVL